MTNEDFAAKYTDELTGLLLSAWSAMDNTRAGEEPDWARRGRWMRDTADRAAKLLGRMHTDAGEQTEVVKEVVREMTTDEKIEAVIKAWHELPPVAQEVITAKFRKAFTKTKETDK